jgi:hypothetical protein
MSGSADSKQQSLAHLSELERKLEKLLNWAKSHTEIGLDFVNNDQIEVQNQMKSCFVRSLELGKELIGNLGNEGNREPRIPAVVRFSRRDSVLPLSGSSRFGENTVVRSSAEDIAINQSFAQSFARVNCASHQSARPFPLAPSKSYSKKKAF